MPKNNFIKNITSKDINLSQNTILNMIKTSSLEDFKELCKNSDFIFPFLKERIIKDFVKLIDKENLTTVFNFSKIYCLDFEDLIINSWLKYACEDLTDDILELFENGSDEQKAYCALYFKHIQDPLALEYLNKYAYSDFEALKINCAQTLGKFRDKKVYEEMKNIILNSQDDFEKNSAYSFLSAYGGSETIDFILDNCFANSFKIQIVANLLDFYDFNTIKNLDKNKVVQIFSTLIEGYPEYIDLNTIGFYRILDFAELINSYNIQYAKNALILAREKFREFFENDIYTFDLDKTAKEDLKEIYNFLKSLSLSTDLKEELKQYNTNQYELALSVIQELKLKDYTQILADNLEKLNEEFIAKTVVILKELKACDLIPLNILNKIQNENIKALTLSCIE